MRALGSCGIGLVCAAMLVAGPAAWAQNVILDAPGLTGRQKAPAPPLPRPAPTVWPRLDPGAVLCRSQEDLYRHAANIVARVKGGDLQRADCRMINQPVGIQIVSRHGPGSTEVKLTGSGSVTGWTDVWLPDKAPAAR